MTNPPGPPPSDTLRVAAFASLAVGAVTIGVGGVIAPVGVAVAIALTAGAALLSKRLVTPDEATVRRRVAMVALTCAAIAALVVTRGDVTDSTGPVLGLLLCTAAVTHSLVLDTVRDLRVNTAIAASMLVLAAGLAPGLRLAAPVVLTWSLVVTALVLAARDAEGASAHAHARTSGAAPNPVAPIAGAVAATVLVGLAIALVLPHPTGLTARSGFGQRASGTETPSPGSGSSARGAQAYLGGGALSLDGRGRLPDTAVAVVSGTESRLWRSTSLDVYDGHGWSATETTPRNLSDLGSTEAAVPPDPRAPAQNGTGTRSDGVGWLLATTDDPVILSPGLLTKVRLRTGGDVVLASDRRVLAVGPSPTPSYVTESEQVPTIDQPSLSVVAAAPDVTRPEWTDLPGTVPSRVADLARQVTAQTSDRVGAVRAIENYLRSTYTYDLDSPVAPAGNDSVDDFLFVSRSGFCEHFASAEVVLLRTLGIPSRLVTGFAGGAPLDGNRVLRASDAHAWVEVWVPGTGWASSDPTAGSTQAEPHSSAFAAAMKAVREATTGSTVRKVVLAVVLLALAALALYLPTRRRRRLAGAVPARPSAPLFAAFHRLETALAATGRPRGESESVRALATRLQATDDVVDALLTVERASYAAVPPSRAEAHAATDVIDRATARLLSETTS